MYWRDKNEYQQVCELQDSPAGRKKSPEPNGPNMEMAYRMVSGVESLSAFTEQIDVDICLLEYFSLCLNKMLL